MLCTFQPLAKGDLVDHVASYLNYVQRLLGDDEGAMQEQQIAALHLLMIVVHGETLWSPAPQPMDDDDDDDDAHGN